MEADDMEIEIPLENYYMDGEMLLENDDMDDDYTKIGISLENHYMDGQLL